MLGPGGVGGFLAGALARAGTPVTVVAREGTAAAIAREGIAVESVRLGTFTVHPPAVAVLERSPDVLVVATKASGLEDALERVAPAAAEPGLVVPLLNGLDHVALLRERFGQERVVAGTIRIEAVRAAPGRIVHTSPFLRVEVAPRSRPAEAFAHLLRAAEVPAQVLDSEAQVLWSKLVRLNALACTTSAHGEALGAIRGHPRWRLELEGAIDEGAAVARAEGADVDGHAVLAELAEAHPGLLSSMARDIAAGAEPELDAIPGAVLRAAARHGVPCPTIEGLVEQVRRRIA